jgi:hypothetical protein
LPARRRRASQPAAWLSCPSGAQPRGECTKCRKES